mgnify:FL=1
MSPLLPRVPLAVFFGGMLMAACGVPILILQLAHGLALPAAGIAAMGGACVAALGTYLLQRWVVRPLKDAVLVIRAASDGELDGRVEQAHLREIEGISQAFNRMAESVQEAADSLTYRAFHDSLTGLPNRALFLSTFTRALAGTEHANRVAIMFLDVDRFKYLNDSLGHGVGDQLLSVFSQRLVSAAEGQMVARLGGDEFTVLVQSSNAQATAMRIAERVLYSLRRPFSLSGQEMFVSSSIGIAVSTAADRTSGELLRKADIALYRAKAEGRSRFVLFTEELDRTPTERFDLDNALRRSVERDELLLHYQPLVDLRTGDICGTEALLRWNHPHRGILSPATFISIAEETGEIVRIGQWVLEESCRHAVEFQRLRPSYPLTLCVNISAAEFRQHDLPRRIAEILEETGLPARQLKLELTESVLIHDIPSTLDMLGELRDLGVGLAIDDFGTGYSSLSYLQRLPVDTLKVDRSFIARLGVDATSGPVLRAIVEMGNALNMNVIAEGIENQWQWDYLADIGCRQGQGHFFRPPLEAREFADLLASHRPIQTIRPRRLPRPA